MRRFNPDGRRGVVPLLAALAILTWPHAGFAGGRMTSVAVFPVENLSAGMAPIEEIRAFLIDRLLSAQIRVLPDAALESFMRRHRVRYAAGIDTETARLLRDETNVDGIVVVSIDLWDATPPPRVGITARLISITSNPTLVWADDFGVAGDDAPGFFDLGIVNDHAELLGRGLDRLCTSLLHYLRTGSIERDVKGSSRFRPKTAYRAITFEPGSPSRVAVVPFVNMTDRRQAGEILALLFMRHLAAFAHLQVTDSGVVRRQLLNARIIMNGGPSLSDAETVAALIDADYVLGGRVLRYEDHAGGAARVEFSAVLIERRQRRVVWSSESYNGGNERRGLFGRGVTGTAHGLATRMTRMAAEMIAGRDQ